MEVSTPQVEEITRHHRYTLDELESLLQSLRMELEVAPTDHKAHQDLFSRIIRVAERGLQLPNPNDYLFEGVWGSYKTHARIFDLALRYMDSPMLIS
jgi:hypothetical protein